MRAARLLAAALLAGVLAACGSSGSPAVSPLPALSDPGTAQRYVAVGASETVGAGIDDDALRLRDAWPQLFFNSALSRTSTMVNLGIPGATTAVALGNEIPQALSLDPTVVTVWLNVDDIVNGVPAATYEQQLGDLVHRLRTAPGRPAVLVANTPVLTHLPALLACRSGGRCPLPTGVSLPSDAGVEALVGDYNAAVQRVTEREGAVLVDLHAEGDVPVSRPELVASDGFHPSFLGHAEVARLFAAAYRAHVQ